MSSSDLSMTALKIHLRAGACAIVVAGAAAGCTTAPSDPIPDIPPIGTKTAKELCAETGYDPNILVFRDHSSRFRLAAVGVTASGGLKDFGAAVGSSVITSRGGATVTGGNDINVDARSCDTFKDDS